MEYIRTNKSSYGALILFVKKKDDKLNLCLDYRILNKMIVQNNYHLPNIDDLFDRLMIAKYFNQIDVKSCIYLFD